MARNKYDFILFENFHNAEHHIFDMMLTARILKSQGMEVGVLDIYKEYTKDSGQGITIIPLPFADDIPNDHWQKAPRNKLHSLFCKLRFLWQQHWYLKKVIKYIAPLADNFYCGSYHLLMSTQLMKLDKPCYFWGLRSSRMTRFRQKFRKEPIETIQAIRLKHDFFKNNYCRLFVSNEIICNEFKSLGIDCSKIVIREERCIDQLDDDNASSMDKATTFLVIGMLREEKNIPFTVKAFQKANIASSKLYLVGRSQGQYENIVETSINGDCRIIRINRFLEYDEFNAYFAKSHFVLFADEQGPSCITNGTMMEALINHRPIICPDYNPYSYYIKKHKVGLTYTPGECNSYAAALKQATDLGAEFFFDNINKFLETITFEQVSQKLVQSLKEKS